MIVSGIPTSVIFQTNTINNASNLFIVTTRATSLGSSNGHNGSPIAYTIITGTITVNVGGVISVQFAENAAIGGTTGSVLVGSTFIVTEII